MNRIQDGLRHSIQESNKKFFLLLERETECIVNNVLITISESSLPYCKEIFSPYVYLYTHDYKGAESYFVSIITIETESVSKVYRQEFKYSSPKFINCPHNIKNLLWWTVKEELESSKGFKYLKKGITSHNENGLGVYSLTIDL